MKHWKKHILYWGQVLLIPIYLLSYLSLRSKKIWVLGSTFGQRFADNPKYFYLYLNQEQKNIKAIWITKNHNVIKLLINNNMKVYSSCSIKGFWYCLRAKVYLYDNYTKDICFWLSGGAIKINMWHGIPLKKINMDNKFDHVRNPKNILGKIRWALRRMSDEKSSHFVLTTSDFLYSIFSSAFNTKKVLSCGYPRNDILVSDKIKNICSAEEQSLLDKIQAQRKSIVLYMPTFRESETGFFDIMRLVEFNHFLIDNNMLFCIKLHPKSNIQKRLTDFLKENSYNNILMIDAQADPYPFLNIAEVLVTDYSSIYFDYLLKDKPIIFFDYDKEEYLKNSREMYFDYDEFTPGVKVNNMNSLEKELLQRNNNRARCLVIKNKVFNNYEQCSSEVLYEKIKSILR